MAGRNWIDQPLEVEGTEIVLSTFIDIGPIKGHSIEIRKGTNYWYLTTGNLFGSQTVQCRDAEAALRCLAHAHTAKKDKPVPVPDGCVLLKNSDKLEEIPEL